MGVVVRQKVKGKGQPWWVFINHNGNRKAKQVGDKAAAEALASKIRERLKAGDLKINTKKIPTFGDYAEKWLSGYGETHLKHSTLCDYRSVIRNHLGSLLDKSLDQVGRAEIKELLYEKLKGNLAPQTVIKIKNVISAVFSHAIEDEVLTVNPVARLGRMIKKDKRQDVNPLRKEEARDFLATVKGHYPRYYPFFLCALRTGMRLGELLALEWGDIDFRSGFIEVRRSYVKGIISTPKNGKARRVDMSRQLAETLKALRTDRKREALAKGWKEVPDLIFVNEACGILDHANLRTRVFWPALTKTGLRRMRIHDLRHTFASLLIQQGESLAYVKEQLGHHSIQITVDIYGHLVPGANREAVNRLDDDISSSCEKISGCV